MKTLKSFFKFAAVATVIVSASSCLTSCDVVADALADAIFDEPSYTVVEYRPTYRYHYTPGYHYDAPTRVYYGRR